MAASQTRQRLDLLVFRIGQHFNESINIAEASKYKQETYIMLEYSTRSMGYTLRRRRLKDDVCLPYCFGLRDTESLKPLLMEAYLRGVLHAHGQERYWPQKKREH